MRSAENEKKATAVSLIQKKWFRWSLLLLFVIVILFITQSFFGGSEAIFSSMGSGTDLSSGSADTIQSSCKYHDDDPELFYLKTISGVHYDGGHWFHVAENFMVQHSLFRSRESEQEEKEAKAPEVYFLTDRGGYPVSLSPSPLVLISVTLSEF